MKKGLIFLVMFCAAIGLQAQQKFNVQNGTKTEFYNDLETAVQKAVSGDTIYLPGGEIQLQNDWLVINKKLALVGTGWDIDSIGGLKRTAFVLKNGNQGGINFREGSSGSLLTGCVLGEILFGFKDEVNDVYDDINNVTIWRNLINKITLGVNDNPANKVKNITIRENRIGFGKNDDGNFQYTIDGKQAKECLLSNNLINAMNAPIFNLYNSYLYNNVIKERGSYNFTSTLLSVYGCYIQNNYFQRNGVEGTILYSCDNNSFYNNAFNKEITFPQGNNSGANNLVNLEPIKTFQKEDTNWPKNLQIRDNSPCKNAGADGTDIGIYGGSAPYKPGGVPFNPHITLSSVSVQTDKDGNLKVNMQVSAQTK